MRINQAIKLARNTSGITQHELCQRAGIGHSTISMVEAGKNASLDIMRKITRALGIPLLHLFILAAEEEDIEGLDETQLKLMKIAILNKLTKGT